MEYEMPLLEVESLDLESLDFNEIKVVSSSEALESLVIGHGMVEVGASCCGCAPACCCSCICVC